MSGDELLGRSPLLVVIGGRCAKIVNDMDLPEYIDVLVLDTDSRTERSFPGLNVVTVGSRVVKGEGSGGNMNLARVCFRIDMNRIAPMVLGRNLVLILTTTDGATGIAGAVELSSLLVKVGMASFTFLLHQEIVQSGGMDPLKIASILLDGPLRPGCIIMGGSRPHSKPEDPYGLKPVISSLLRSGSGIGGYSAPQAAWIALREDGGPFNVGTLVISDDPAEVEINPPALISLSVPERMTNSEVRSRLESTFGGVAGVHLALYPEKDATSLEGAYISKTYQKPHFPEGPPPDPETLKELMGDPSEMEMELNFEII